MKLLDPVFESCGFLHTQLKRVDNVEVMIEPKQKDKPAHKEKISIAIYQRDRIKNATPTVDRDGVFKPHYEVIIIQSHNGFKVPGTDTYTEPSEYYPGNERWGTLGWTYNSLAKAELKLNQLNE